MLEKILYSYIARRNGKSLTDLKTAIEKATPEKLYKFRWKKTTYHCPRCYFPFKVDEPRNDEYLTKRNYCPDCGQRIDWEEGGEE